MTTQRDVMLRASGVANSLNVAIAAATVFDARKLDALDDMVIQLAEHLREARACIDAPEAWGGAAPSTPIASQPQDLPLRR